jgi:putative glutamine amidotransferase
MLGVPYIDRIKEAGGVPVMLPFVASLEEAREVLSRVDGVLLTGGNDVNPERWGEKLHPKAELLHPVKEQSDILYAQAAMARDMATFGICLGSQILNIARGGSLHQHMADLPKIHDAHQASAGKTHQIDVAEGVLRSILGYSRGVVNSWHHQAYNKIGEGLKVVAVAEDGIPEALISLNNRFVLGVQWHPERMADDPAQRRLFASFIQACR